MLTLLARITQRPLTVPATQTRRYRPGRDKDLTPKSQQQRMVAAVTRSSKSSQAVRACAVPFSAICCASDREDDNDIRIPNGSIHRYHAAIHREEYDDWHITDLSGVEGNGLIVNGRRCCEARLTDGDLIQLGPGRLRFRDGFA